MNMGVYYLYWWQEWNGKYFGRKTVKDLGLTVQLGHPIRERRHRPWSVPKDKFVVVHNNRIHVVCLTFCGWDCRNPFSTVITHSLVSCNFQHATYCSNILHSRRFSSPIIGVKAFLLQVLQCSVTSFRQYWIESTQSMSQSTVQYLGSYLWLDSLWAIFENGLPMATSQDAQTFGTRSWSFWYFEYQRGRVCNIMPGMSPTWEKHINFIAGKGSHCQSGSKCRLTFYIETLMRYLSPLMRTFAWDAVQSQMTRVIRVSARAGHISWRTLLSRNIYVTIKMIHKRHVFLHQNTGTFWF